MTSPFVVLGISTSSTVTEARAAFRKLAQKHHPDKGGDTATFQSINAAFASIEAGYTEPPPQPQYQSSFTEGIQPRRYSKPEPTNAGASYPYDPMRNPFGYKPTQAYRRAQPKVQPLYTAPRVVTAQRIPERQNIGEYIARVSLAEAYNGFACEVHHKGTTYSVQVPKGVPSGLRFTLPANDKTDVTIIVAIRENEYKFLSTDTALNESTMVNGVITKVFRTKELSIVHELSAYDHKRGCSATLTDFLGASYTVKIPAGQSPRVPVRVPGRGYVDWYSGMKQCSENRGDVLVYVRSTEEVPMQFMKF